MSPIQTIFAKAGPTLRDSDGFTLIELLIGMAIFAIGTLAIAGLQTHSANLNTHARRSLEIESHMARLVEDYKNLAWNDVNGDGLLDDIDIDEDGVVDDLNIRDEDGDGINGINHTGADADYFIDGGVIRAGDTYELSINVAPNVLTTNTLTINLIAQWNHLSQQKTYNVLFLKARDL